MKNKIVIICLIIFSFQYIYSNPLSVERERHHTVEESERYMDLPVSFQWTPKIEETTAEDPEPDNKEKIGSAENSYKFVFWEKYRTEKVTEYTSLEENALNAKDKETYKLEKVKYRDWYDKPEHKNVLGRSYKDMCTAAPYKFVPYVIAGFDSYRDIIERVSSPLPSLSSCIASFA